MTKDEIIKTLNSVGVITIIADEFFLTEKYKELLTPSLNAPKPIAKKEKALGKLNYDEILNTAGGEHSWPAEIEHTTGRIRCEHFMNYCKIPDIGGVPPKTYRLRGLPKECLTIIDNIVNSEEVSPISMLKAIEIYYKYTTMPKSFKNLLLEGEVINIYHEYIKGTLEKNIKPKDNTGSQKWN